ncbi:hypothetical protein PNI0009_01756, partial [Streptococcus pneumoniae PNI0009]
LLSIDLSIVDQSTLKIHPNSLYRWIQEYEKYEESAFPGHGSALRHTQFEM